MKPADLIEWMRFLHAYALNGKINELLNLMNAIQADDYVLAQACETLQSLQTDTAIQRINSQYCISPK